MDAVGKLGAEKVVYVSCNPETLARDVRYMKKMGYRAEEAWLVDMFPGRCTSKPSWNYHVKPMVNRHICSCFGCLAYHLPTLFWGGSKSAMI